MKRFVLLSERRCIQSLQPISTVSYTHLDVYKRQSQDLPLVIIRLLSIISATTRRERKVTTILSHMMRLNMYLFRGQMMNHSLLYRMPQTEVTRLRQVPE